MKAHYEAQGKQVFDYLPVTFHIKRYGDAAWVEFEKYYTQDERAQDGERVWIVKPGENSNRGKGITVHSEWEGLRRWVAGEIGGENNPRKTLIVQKYISRPLLYHRRKFDIRCYMLLVRLVSQFRCRTGRSGATGTRRGTSAPAAASSTSPTPPTSSSTSPTTLSRSTPTSTAGMRTAIS